MKHFIKTVSFLAVMSVIPGLFAATSRVGVVTKNATRQSSIRAYINPTTIVGTTTTSLLDLTDCTEKYISCMSESEVCGEEFEACPNKTLFHNQMGKCASVLTQCSPAGVQALFGNANIANLYQKTYTGKYNDVVSYTYPLDDMLLGDMIISSSKANRYDVAQCSKKYTTCLKRDSVCGEDFELCTTKREFKRQALACNSTLARCVPEGIESLFGKGTDVWEEFIGRIASGSDFEVVKKTQSDDQKVEDLAIKTNSVIDGLIKSGAALAAKNAVSTCYKVADQCILGACSKNPSKCLVGTPVYAGNLVDLINSMGTEQKDGTVSFASTDINTMQDTLTKRAVTRYLKDMCLETIGSNKYCYMTHNINETDGVKKRVISPEEFETLMYTKSEVERQEMYDEVFGDIYETRMNSATNQRLNDMMDKYNQKAADKCSDTIKTCAMRVCGGGIGAYCWEQVFDTKAAKTDPTKANIASGDTYKEIQVGCQAVVNADPNCVYTATIRSVNNGTWSNWIYDDSAGVFGYLFPENGTGTTDVIGVITSLNGALATAYDKSSIANMAQQCKDTAMDCVESMCGKDFQYCYRQRTDISLARDARGAYNTNNSTLDDSMNKQTGILDYNIAIGLCMDTVTKAKVCNEHLKIRAKRTEADLGLDWGNSTTVADAWGSAAQTAVCKIDINKESDRCNRNGGVDKSCRCQTAPDYIVGKCGDWYEMPSGSKTVKCQFSLKVENDTKGDIQYKAAADTVLREALADVELKAQAQYKSRLQREQNVCLANDSGGIKTGDSTTAIFRWVKLGSGSTYGYTISNNNNQNKSYEMNGLEADQITDSSDLFGSFCAAKVTVQFNHPTINKLKTETGDRSLKDLGNYETRYFAVGDSFVCGSWIPQSVLDNVTEQIRDDKDKDKDTSNWSTKEKGMIALGTILGTGAGAFAGGLLGEYAKTGKVFGSSRTDEKSAADKDTYSGTCIIEAEKCSGTTWTSINSHCQKAINAAASSKVLGSDDQNVTTARKAYNEAKKAYDAWKEATSTDKDAKKSELDTKVSEMVDAVSALISPCQDQSDKNFESVGGKMSRGGAIGLGSVLGGVVAGASGGAIAWAAIQAKHEKAADKAVQEWLDNVGQYIQCYVGTTYVGSYGDTVGLTVSDNQ